MSKSIKRALSLLLCAALLFGAAPLNGFVGLHWPQLNLPSLSSLFAVKAHAADPTSGTCGTNLTWNYDEATATLTISGTGVMSSYSDSFYNGAYVTSAPWKTYYQTMQTVVINSGVTSIGSKAFYRCTGLTSVTIGNSVTSIGDYAFLGCTGLTSVTIPDSVVSIGYGAFDNCRGLTAVTIGNSVTSIGSEAFYNCRWLTSVTIPDSVTSIGDYAFFNCTGLTSVTIPDSVTSIGSYAFSCVANIVYYGSASGSPWGARAANGYLEAPFVYADSTKTTLLACPSSNQGEITIPDSVTSIGNSAFYNCTALTSVTIGNSVTSIGNYAFQYCIGLTSVTIPNSVTSIGRYAFDDCTGLLSVAIPNNVTSIGDNAFNNVNNVVYYGSASGSPWGAKCFNGYVEEPFLYADSAKSTLLACSPSCRGEITIPNSVTSIGEFAFEGCTGLTSVTIPNSVTSIGGSAFHGCTGLTSVTIGNGVTSIGDGAFYECTGLTSVTIPDSVTSVGDYAFYNCTGLASVTIGSGSGSVCIGGAAFAFCCNLTSLTIFKNSVSLDGQAFFGCVSLTTVLFNAKNYSVSKGNYFDGEGTPYPFCFTADDAAALMRYFLEEMEQAGVSFDGTFPPMTVIVGEGVESLPANLFRGAENVEQVILPRSVKTISKTFLDPNCDAVVYCPKGSYAQTCCIRYGWVYGLLDSSSSPEFIIANGALLHYVGDKTQVALPQVDTIGAGALNGNTQIVSVEVSSATSEIFDEAFANCPALQRVILPASVTYISAYAFTVSDNVVIYCVEGSYAQQFAMNNGIPYELITVTFNRPEVVLRPNQTLQLNAAYSVALSESDLLWQSDNASVATVSDSGLVTAVGSGRAVVTAANENGLTVQCVVGVTDSDFSLQQLKGELDTVNNTLYGLRAGVTADELKNEYFTASGSCRLDCEGTLATGDKVSLIETTTGVKAAEYTVVIFGDVNGSGWYDGTDAYFVSLVAHGLIPASALTDAQRMAADCNHDGIIDNADIALLEQAGLLLSQVDQTLPREELQANSTYLEYCSLIDQSIEIVEPAPDQPQEPATEQESAAAVWQIIFDLFKRLVNFVTMMFSIVVLPK